MFKRDFATLNSAADKLELAAGQIDGALDTLGKFAEDVLFAGAELVDKLRDNAETLRNEAVEKGNEWFNQETAEPVYDTPNLAATREDKIKFIQAILNRSGLNNTRWSNPEVVKLVPDSVVDFSYKAFGGK